MSSKKDKLTKRLLAEKHNELALREYELEAKVELLTDIMRDFNNVLKTQKDLIVALAGAKNG